MEKRIAWAGGRPGDVRQSTVALLAVAAVATLAVICLIAAKAAGDVYRQDADERLASLATAASAAFNREVGRLDATVQRLAHDEGVVRALADSNRDGLARFAEASPNVSFWHNERRLAGATPLEAPAITRTVDVASRGRNVGRVRADLPLDAELAERLARAVSPRPPDQLLLALGPRAYDASRSRLIELPASGMEDAGAPGDPLRAFAVPLLLDGPDARVVAVAPLDAIDAAADRRQERVLLATVATLLTLLAGVGAAMIWRSRRRHATRRERVELDRRHVREALTLVGDALAASHDTEALLPVIAQTAMETAGATEARLLRGEIEIFRAGRRSASRAPLVLPIGIDDDGNPLRLLIYSPGGEPSGDARELAEWFVSQAAIAFENARLHGVVKRQAVTDDLTGLANRRHFVQSLESELSRAERFGIDLAVIIGDLDDFKSINDRFGHEFGNDVLRAVGDLLRASSRDVDVAARLGGEEFAMLLPQTDLEGGAALAERVREGLSALELQTPGGERLVVTASFGVASYPPTDTVEQLLRVADSALYRAKAAGKDRVTAG
ncbi:MAG: GGDEF domain-containing protein [Actinobacteria bacterium]|nr:GGDEF domain-containing protein [Actinomycetota bacterium]